MSEIGMEYQQEIVGGVGLDNKTEVFGGLGEVSQQTSEPNKNIELSGDWKILSGLQIAKPENYDLLTTAEGTELLEKAVLSSKRVAGMKEELREKYDGLSDRYLGLLTKVKAGELSIAEALRELDGKEETNDKIEEL